jgi:protoporphyrinogen oxidase
MASTSNELSPCNVPRPVGARSPAGQTIILGAGITGLGAAWASGLPVYEAGAVPGGVCASYYLRPGEDERLSAPPEDGEAWRFEVGGGHWIFGGDPEILRLIQSLAPARSYERRSAVFLPDEQRLVPYPIQNHLRCLDPETARRALREISDAAGSAQRQRSTPTGDGSLTARNGLRQSLPVGPTMAEWLRNHFGPTLYEKFFGPFHALYTAQLHERIAPQDPHKSPINIEAVRLGAQGDVPPAGYNVSFLYPEHGLDRLARALSARSDIRHGKRVTAIDTAGRTVRFDDGAIVSYKALISTLPLSTVMALTGLKVESPPDPHTSVLVLNLGAHEGPCCPSEHWVYVPRSRSGFHRVGIYSHVDRSFLPRSMRGRSGLAAFYVESAFLPENRPDAARVENLCHRMIEELREWRWIEGVEVVSPTWIEVAYTWSLPGSTWRDEALGALESHGIRQVGRYARWSFRGIADSLRDGLRAGKAKVARRPASETNPGAE